jgi:hypothetical protein
MALGWQFEVTLSINLMKIIGHCQFSGQLVAQDRRTSADAWRSTPAIREQGHGELLLFDAFARALRNEIASHAFVVDAKDG